MNWSWFWLEKFGRLKLLRVVADLEPEAYGVPIRQRYEQEYMPAGHIFSCAAMYYALDAMEQRGWLTSRSGDPTPERGNRPKRYYALTDAGREALGRREPP